jgi:hypothetical protein
MSWHTLFRASVRSDSHQNQAARSRCTALARLSGGRPRTPRPALEFLEDRLCPSIPAAGDSFTLLSSDDSSPITGTFAGLDEGAVFSQNRLTFQITYQGGPQGNRVVLTRLG